MFKVCKVWTLFGKDEPEIIEGVHDVHVSAAGVLLVQRKNGDQIGYYLSNVRRWELLKGNE
jgi:hypothetical protein